MGMRHSCAFLLMFLANNKVCTCVVISVGCREEMVKLEKAFLAGKYTPFRQPETEVVTK